MSASPRPSGPGRPLGRPDPWDAIDWPRLAEKIALAQHRACAAPERYGHGFAAMGQALREELSQASSGVVARGEMIHATERAVVMERTELAAVGETVDRLLRERATDVADTLDWLAQELVRMAANESSQRRGDGWRAAAAVVADVARERRALAAKSIPA
jgi:hypothetical protein